MDNVFTDGLVTAVMGYAFVFLGIVLLMIVMIIMGKIMSAKGNKQETKKTAEPAPVVEAEKAPGTAGELKLYDTDPKTAAMIMAIVADKTGKPLNELRFKSIKEVKQ